MRERKEDTQPSNAISQLQTQAERLGLMTGREREKEKANKRTNRQADNRTTGQSDNRTHI